MLSRTERRAGGRWAEREANRQTAASIPSTTLSSPGSGDFPFQFQTYLSPLLGDGSGSGLWWLQEAPDQTSSAMWSQPLEIDPATARDLGVANGDALRVISSSGELTAPVYVHPAAVPGVVSLALGARTGSPFALTSARESATGVPTMTASVRLMKTDGRPGFIQYSTVDREHRLVRIGESHG